MARAKETTEKRYVIQTISKMFVRVLDRAQPTLSFVADSKYATVMSYEDAVVLLELVGPDMVPSVAQPGDGDGRPEIVEQARSSPYIFGTRVGAGPREYWAVEGPGVEDFHALDEVEAARTADALRRAYERGMADKAREIRHALGAKP